ncbi:hypothetical protein [Ruania halotolerans]|uniref:hypothetical protein n=1 Tax=Ruania halotolerans TaxID=2897773 RepID=UPI001E4D0D4E|nr:hypothetical protein [Ruania halotolerans]UFU07969.1 hypothetical protein LQF10_07685 [Ruania halotolerans]
MPVRWQPSTPQNAFVAAHANPNIVAHTTPEPLPGVVRLACRDLSDEEPCTERWRAWKQASED